MYEQSLQEQLKTVQELKACAQKLEENSLGIQALEANVRRILASVYMLEMNLEAKELLRIEDR